MTGRGRSRLAVLDLGSATVNVLVADVDVEGPESVHVARVRTDSVLVELGRCLAETGSLRAAERRLMDGIDRLLAATHDATATVADGTAALRTARDGPAMVDAIDRRFGLPVRLLTERREAELGVLGALDEIKSGRTLFVDLGGGSTQVVLLRDRQIVDNSSVPLGASVLAPSLADPRDAGAWAALDERIAGAVDLLPVGIATRGLSVGGTARHLAAIAGVQRGHDQRVLSRRALSETLDELRQTDVVTFGARHGLEPAVVRLLAPGGMLLRAILDHHHLDRTRTSSLGLRDGVLKAFSVDPNGWWRDTSTGGVVLESGDG